MKKLIACALLVSAAASSAAWAQYGGIQVTVDGRNVPFDQPPVMQGTRILVPLRGVFEQLGATVFYNTQNRTIQAKRNTDVVMLELGSRTAFVNGQQRTLDTPAQSFGGRAMVPLRFVSEALGANVTWNPTNRLVQVTSGTLATRPVVPPVQPPPPVQLIQSITLNSRGPIFIGRDLNVTMYAASGGRATFDVGNRTNLPLTEGPQGTYKGFYTVRAGDNMQNVLVTGHIVMPDRRQSAMNAPTPVTLEGTEGARPPVAHPFIRSFVHNVSQPLVLGQILQATLVGAPGGLATFEVGRDKNIPMTEVSPGTYVGSFSPGMGEVEPQARVEGHIRMPNGQTDRMDARVISVYGVPR